MEMVWLNKNCITRVLHRDLSSDACCRLGLVFLSVGMVTWVLEGPKGPGWTTPHVLYLVIPPTSNQNQPDSYMLLDRAGKTLKKVTEVFKSLA